MEDARAAFSDAGDVCACTLRASSRWRARRRTLALALGAFSAVATPHGAAINAGPGLVRLAQRAGPHISVPSVVTANPASRVMLPIRVDPLNSMPNQSYVRIDGLPANVSLNDGHSIGAGSFAIPLYAVEALKANIPAGSSGRSELVISLVSVDGMILAEARSALVIGPPAAISTPAEIPAGPPTQDLAAPQHASPPVPAIASAPPPHRPSAEERELAEKLLVQGERCKRPVALSSRGRLGLCTGAAQACRHIRSSRAPRLQVQGVAADRVRHANGTSGLGSSGHGRQTSASPGLANELG
jgi:hypothetical protein